MSTLKVNVDRMYATSAVAKNPFVLFPNGRLTIVGWAHDAQTHEPMTAVSVVVDGEPTASRTTTLERPDVARHFADAALSRCGFTTSFGVASLGLGPHRFALRFELDAGRSATLDPIPFEVCPFLETPSMIAPRILVAAAPKSGSTFIAAKLAEYYDAPAPVFDYDWNCEHVVTDDLIRQLGGHRYVLQLHAMPRTANLITLRTHSIAAVVTWRNLADTVISYDDHHRKESIEGPYAYIGDRERLLALPDQERYAFIIRNIIPWHLGFYCAWRDVGAPIVARYERMTADMPGFFAEIIERLSGTVDMDRLHSVLGARREDTRFNKGVGGRSIGLMSDATKALLEETIICHYADLSELIDELPWRAGVLA